jgi:chromatin segregation and condensation protein Rec8/ScpA/Scc1 (kleisin family)
MQHQQVHDNDEQYEYPACIYSQQLERNEQYRKYNIARRQYQHNKEFREKQEEWKRLRRVRNVQKRVERKAHDELRNVTSVLKQQQLESNTTGIRRPIARRITSASSFLQHLEQSA